MHFKIAKSAQSYFNNIMNLEGSHAAEDKNKLVNLRERTTNIRVFRISLQIILRKKLVCCLNIIRLPKMV